MTTSDTAFPSDKYPRLLAQERRALDEALLHVYPELRTGDVSLRAYLRPYFEKVKWIAEITREALFAFLEQFTEMLEIRKKGRFRLEGAPSWAH